MNANPVRIDNALNTLFLSTAAAVFVIAQAVSLMETDHSTETTAAVIGGAAPAGAATAASAAAAAALARV